MRWLGFVEGRNLTVAFELRRTERDLAALSTDATELARLQVDVLVALRAEPSWKACASAVGPFQLSV
jgi:hypothetical protein